MKRGYILIGVGALGLLYGLYNLYRMLAFKKWGKTTGRVVTAVKESKRLNFEKVEDPKITYEYVVDQKTYRSSVVKASGQISTPANKKGPSEVDKLLEKYPEGSEVTVYYNPSMPRMACLEQGEGAALLIGLVFGPLAMIVGYFVFL